VAQLRAMLADPLFDARRIGESKAAGHRIMLARALRNLGRYDEALPLAEAAAAATGRILGPDDYTTLVQLSTVASIHDYAGRCGQALEIARVVRARMAARYGEERQATLIETGNLGFKEYDCGDREAGLDHLRRAERGLRERYGADNVAAHSFRYALARALADEGRHEEGLRAVDGLSVEALTAGDSTPGWEHRLRALRGRLLLQAGDLAAGRGLLAGALPARDALGSEDPDDLARRRRLRLQAGDRAAGRERRAGALPALEALGGEDPEDIARLRALLATAAGGGEWAGRPQSTTKVTRMFTRHSAIPPSGDVTTLVSLIQAPWMFLMVSAALARPVRTASSTLVGDEALSSMILATAMDFLHWCDANGRGCNRLHLHPLRQRPRSVDCYDSTDESRPQPRAGRPDGRRQVLDRPPPGRAFRPGLRRRRRRDRGAHRRQHPHH